MSKQHFKQTIEELIAKFERNIDKYKDPSSSFNETQLRIEFIDPMFEALGWDMNNKAGAAEQYKEVIHEDKVYIEGKPKAPDYSFKFWGERKFFLEAKQPFVNIYKDYKPALQLRRYAWSAHLPISILSDFEEFAIYDTTIEPRANDSSSVSRLTYYKYTDYLQKWEEIYDLFAKESVQQGSFDKFIAKEKRGSQLVDKVFLKEIESWREWLAKDIAKNNEYLTVSELNFAVQKIIDRIIFLRIAEDRGIERYKTLEQVINSKDSYDALVKHFKVSQDKYNSGLFDFEADVITPKLKISDKLLDKILEHLYYPNSPYEFSVLGVEVLGSIYEQFLGKVIRLTAGHNAKVEEKPEVKKAGGVYYTPQYIVEYIVKNTVGELLKDKTVKQAEKIKILDPACGSGSFLIGAYEYLLNWHLSQYEQLSEAEKAKLEKKGVLFKLINKESTGKSTETWQLTTTEKKRIMLNNIYGVDIDEQAVEVTKLSLALKMLENENKQTINKQLTLLTERILPDMNGNIKCGNSLVDIDILTLIELSDNELKSINPFHWDSEYENIFNTGGFDVVIGNPPYDVLEKDRNKSTWPHDLLSKYIRLKQAYMPAVGGKTNLYRIFLVKSWQLLKNKGRFSMIIPASILADLSSQPTRKFMIEEYDKIQIDAFPQKDNASKRVFENAKLSTTIFTGEKAHNKNNILVRTYEWNSFQDSRKEVEINKNDIELIDSNSLPIPLIEDKDMSLIHKIAKTTIKLGDYQGIEIRRGEINQTVFKKYISDKPNEQKLLKGVQVGLFRINKEISQGKIEYFNSKLYFEETGKENKWYNKVRLATQRITGIDERFRVVSSLISEPFHFADSTNSINLKNDSEEELLYILGFLNSKLIQWRFKLSSTNNNVGTNELAALPIIPFSQMEPTKRKEFIDIISNLLKLSERMQKATTGATKEAYDLNYKSLNKIIYEQLELNSPEIEVIEKSNE